MGPIRRIRGVPPGWGLAGGDFEGGGEGHFIRQQVPVFKVGFKVGIVNTL